LRDLPSAWQDLDKTSDPGARLFVKGYVRVWKKDSKLTPRKGLVGYR
jgi:hypothetical protein